MYFLEYYRTKNIPRQCVFKKNIPCQYYMRLCFIVYGQIARGLAIMIRAELLQYHKYVFFS